MDGTAASNSMAVPSGRRSQTGQVSVRNTAMPKASGTASSSAMPALMTVPTMAMAAPNSSLMMSHSTYQRKWAPNLAKVGQALMNSETMMPTSAISTSSENEAGSGGERWRPAGAASGHGHHGSAGQAEGHGRCRCRISWSQVHGIRGSLIRLELGTNKHPAGAIDRWGRPAAQTPGGSLGVDLRPDALRIWLVSLSGSGT
jgi:hypothetical protein